MRWIVIGLALLAMAGTGVRATEGPACDDDCAAVAKNLMDECFEDDRTPEICLENASKYLGGSVVITAKAITKKLKGKYQSSFVRSQHGWFDYNVGRCLTFAGLKRNDPEFKRSYTTEQTATNAERAIYSMCMIKATVLRGGELQKMLETSF